MTINYGGRIIADLKGAGVHGLKGIGTNLLRFSIQVNPTNLSETSKGITLSNFTAVVLCGSPGQAKQYLCRAVPEMPLTVRALPHPQPTYLLFDACIYPEQLVTLESLRAGGGLEFDVEITCEGHHPEQDFHARETVHFQCDLGAWSKVLESFGHSQLMIVGIPIPRTDGSSVFRDAAELLKRAQNDYVRGEYEDVVARARKVIETVWAAGGIKQEAGAATAQFKKDKELMNKRQRGLLIQEAVRHYAHPPHHVSDDSHWYSSVDAAYILSMAAAVVAEAISREDISPPPSS